MYLRRPNLSKHHYEEIINFRIDKFEDLDGNSKHYIVAQWISRAKKKVLEQLGPDP